MLSSDKICVLLFFLQSIVEFQFLTRKIITFLTAQYIMACCTLQKSVVSTTLTALTNMVRKTTMAFVWESRTRSTKQPTYWRTHFIRNSFHKHFPLKFKFSVCSVHENRVRHYLLYIEDEDGTLFQQILRLYIPCWTISYLLALTYIYNRFEQELFWCFP